MRPDPTGDEARRPDRPTRRPDGGRGGGTVVGVVAGTAVVLAADERTTRGGTVAGEGVEKVAAVHPTAALGATDDLGAVQSLVRTVRSEADAYGTERGEPTSMDALARIAGEAAAGAGVSLVLGGLDLPADGPPEPHCYEVDPDGGVLEADAVAAGSGREVAYGVLEAARDDDRSLAAARSLAARAVEAAAGRDTATGGGIQVAVVAADGVDVERYDAADELADEG